MERKRAINVGANPAPARGQSPHRGTCCVAQRWPSWGRRGGSGRGPPERGARSPTGQWHRTLKSKPHSHSAKGGRLPGRGAGWSGGVKGHAWELGIAPGQLWGGALYTTPKWTSKLWSLAMLFFIVWHSYSTDFEDKTGLISVSVAGNFQGGGCLFWGVD